MALRRGSSVPAGGNPFWSDKATQELRLRMIRPAELPPDGEMHPVPGDDEEVRRQLEQGEESGLEAVENGSERESRGEPRQGRGRRRRDLGLRLRWLGCLSLHQKAGQIKGQSKEVF